MEKVLRGALVLAVLLSVAPYQLWAQMEHRTEQQVALNPDQVNDRLMTDEVIMIKATITKIQAAAETGDTKAIRSGLRAISPPWTTIKHELEVRNERRVIDEFEQALHSVRSLLNGADQQ